MNKENKIKSIISQGEIRIVDNKKTLILPYIEPEYTLRKRRKSRGFISKQFKNRE